MLILNDSHTFQLSISVNKSISEKIFDELTSKHFNLSNITELVKGDFENDYILIVTNIEKVTNLYQLTTNIILNNT